MTNKKRDEVLVNGSLTLFVLAIVVFNLFIIWRNPEPSKADDLRQMYETTIAFQNENLMGMTLDLATCNFEKGRYEQQLKVLEILG